MPQTSVLQQFIVHMTTSRDGPNQGDPRGAAAIVAQHDGSAGCDERGHKLAKFVCTHMPFGLTLERHSRSSVTCSCLATTSLARCHPLYRHRAGPWTWLMLRRADSPSSWQGWCQHSNVMTFIVVLRGLIAYSMLPATIIWSMPLI